MDANSFSSSSSERGALDAAAKRQALRKLTYGAYIVTATAGGEIAAGTVSWFSQASFEPPLIVAGIKADSRLHARIETSGAFAVNLVAADQKDMASAFFRPSQVEGDRINGYAFEPGPETGAPVLGDAPAWFEARVVHAYKGGDHTVVVAEIVSAGVRKPDMKPLVLADAGWTYGG